MNVQDIQYEDNHRVGWSIRALSAFGYMMTHRDTEMPADFVYKIMKSIPKKYCEDFIRYDRKVKRDKCLYKFIHDNKLEDKNIIEVITLHKLYYAETP